MRQCLAAFGRLTSRSLTAAKNFPTVALICTVVLAVASPCRALPVPTNCQVDPQGANDRPGQRDITKFCVDDGDGAPYDIHSIVNADDVRVFGANTVDLCALYNTDGDAFANLAVCVTMKSGGADSDNRLVLKDLRLFGCNDTKADRCMGATSIPKPYTTTCEVSQTDDDPFSPAAVNGPGSDYPWDSRVLCAIDLADFGIATTAVRLLDGCAYPSTVPNSDAEDCVLYQPCTRTEDCDDGNACSTDACDPGGVCTYVPAGDVACTDELFCNGDETCNALGFCETAAESRDCDDGVSCTIDTCDELLESCAHDPRDSSCSDDLYCNGVETCDAADGCIAGTPPDCADSVLCTSDVCNEETDSCSHAERDAACDDGRFCTGEETCSAALGCVHGSVPDCADSFACTVDACDEIAAACSHTPSDGACTNGIFCDGAEVCDPASGCMAGTAPDCDDNVGCTADRCDEDLRTCVNETSNAACSDGILCNGVETCDPVDDCRPGTAPCGGTATCNDDSCSGCSTDADCGNGVFCDGSEICDSTTRTCNAGSSVSCDDGIACTLDACDENAKSCAHTAVQAACDDGLFCNGTETCNVDLGCVNVAGPACDDEIACTADTCVETSDSCRHTPNDNLCDDGRYCNGREVCSALDGCLEGEEVTCRPDRFACTVEQCNEGSDSCSSDFSRCRCGDFELTPGEECEHPRRAGTFEDCNNLVDDNRNGLVDCSDPECLPRSGRGRICDENCRVDLACAPVANDPALMKFQHGRGPDSMWMHGRFAVEGNPDPTAEGFTIRLSNNVQPIFVASLAPGDLKGNGRFFKFLDPDARHLGQASARGGLAAVRLRRRNYDGVPNLTFRILVYGDFSAATHRTMTSQISVGPESGTLTEEWQAKPAKWLLRQLEF